MPCVRIVTPPFQLLVYTCITASVATNLSDPSYSFVCTETDHGYCCLSMTETILLLAE